MANIYKSTQHNWHGGYGVYIFSILCRYMQTQNLFGPEVVMAYHEYIFLCRSATCVVGYISDWAISLHSQSFHRDWHHFTCQHCCVQDISVLCRKKGREQVSHLDWYNVIMLFARRLKDSEFGGRFYCFTRAGQTCRWFTYHLVFQGWSSINRCLRDSVMLWVFSFFCFQRRKTALTESSNIQSTYLSKFQIIMWSYGYIF